MHGHQASGCVNRGAGRGVLFARCVVHFAPGRVDGCIQGSASGGHAALAVLLHSRALCLTATRRQPLQRSAPRASSGRLQGGGRRGL